MTLRVWLCLLVLVLTVPVAARAAADARTQAQDPGRWLMVGQVGGSLFGRVEHSVPSDDDGMSGSSVPTLIEPALDLRLGGAWFAGRWFSLNLASHATSWQTEYFASLGRERNYTIDARLTPMVHVPLRRRSRSVALFAGFGAGPAWSFVSSKIAHVQVAEQTSPKTAFSVVWVHGIDIPIQARWGLRGEVDVQWTTVRYRVTRLGPDGSLGDVRFDDLLRRPLFLVGIWFKP